MLLDWFRDPVNPPELLSLFLIPAGKRVLLSLMGWLLPTRSRRPAAAAHERRMKQATVEVKSFTSMVWRNKKQQSLLWYSTVLVNHRDERDVSSGYNGLCQIDIYICFALCSLHRFKDSKVSLFPTRDWIAFLGDVINFLIPHEDRYPCQLSGGRHADFNHSIHLGSTAQQPNTAYLSH